MRNRVWGNFQIHRSTCTASSVVQVTEELQLSLWRTLHVTLPLYFICWHTLTQICISDARSGEMMKATLWWCSVARAFEQWDGGSPRPALPPALLAPGWRQARCSRPSAVLTQAESRAWGGHRSINKEGAGEADNLFSIWFKLASLSLFSYLKCKASLYLVQ